jgi:hypothetical protein
MNKRTIKQDQRRDYIINNELNLEAPNTIEYDSTHPSRFKLDFSNFSQKIFQKELCEREHTLRIKARE